MTKADLRSGMIITCKNGGEYLIIRDMSSEISPGFEVAISMNGGGYIRFDSITNDLCDTSGWDEWIIIKVEVLRNFKDFTNPSKAERKLVWKRPVEKKKYTYEQIKEILGEEFEIVKG